MTKTDAWIIKDEKDDFLLWTARESRSHCIDALVRDYGRDLRWWLARGFSIARVTIEEHNGK